jgi:hypothetical protein
VSIIIDICFWCLIVVPNYTAWNLFQTTFECFVVIWVMKLQMKCWQEHSANIQHFVYLFICSQLVYTPSWKLSYSKFDEMYLHDLVTLSQQLFIFPYSVLAFLYLICKHKMSLKF